MTRPATQEESRMEGNWLHSLLQSQPHTSKAGFARALKIPAQRVQDLCSGRRLLKVSELTAAAKYFGVSVEEMVKRVSGSNPATVGTRIASRLEAIKMTQSELARRVGISQQAINGLIKSKQAASAYLVPIARALGVSAEWLYDGCEGRHE